ncbi:MAG TPA: hypothetical protein VIG30_12570 [Ktedonobacterales bacterium]|jgi:hypothetical protein
MHKWFGQYVQTHIGARLVALKERSLGAEITPLPVVAHLMAREIIVTALIAALKRITLPADGIVTPDQEVTFAQLLHEETEREFARVLLRPTTWLQPGHPLDLAPHSQVSPLHAAFVLLIAMLYAQLGIHLDGLSAEDVRYIVQAIFDANVLPLPADAADDSAIDARHIELNVPLRQDPHPRAPDTWPWLLTGGPLSGRNEPTFGLPDTALPAEAQLDAAAIDRFVVLMASQAHLLDLPAQDFLVRMRDLEQLTNAMMPLSQEEEDLLQSAYLLELDLHALAKRYHLSPHAVWMKFLDAFAHLQEHWN